MLGNANVTLFAFGNHDSVKVSSEHIHKLIDIKVSKVRYVSQEMNRLSTLQV